MSIEQHHYRTTYNNNLSYHQQDGPVHTVPALSNHYHHPHSPKLIHMIQTDMIEYLILLVRYSKLDRDPIPCIVVCFVFCEKKRTRRLLVLLRHFVVWQFLIFGFGSDKLMGWGRMQLLGEWLLGQRGWMIRLSWCYMFERCAALPV